MKTGDVLDLVTPLVLIPLYWLLFELQPETPPDRGDNLAFLVIAAFWTMGHGMHLATNSLGPLLGGMKGTDVHTLTVFYDETLSHYLWHPAMMALSVLLVRRQCLHPFSGDGTGLALGIAASVIHGFTYFLVVIEGATLPLGFPFAVSVALFGSLCGRERLKQEPLLSFFTIAYLIATLLFIVWGLYWGGWPEFSEVGLI